MYRCMITEKSCLRCTKTCRWGEVSWHYVDQCRIRSSMRRLRWSHVSRKRAWLLPSPSDRPMASFVLYVFMLLYPDPCPFRHQYQSLVCCSISGKKKCNTIFQVRPHVKAQMHFYRSSDFRVSVGFALFSLDLPIGWHYGGNVVWISSYDR